MKGVNRGLATVLLLLVVVVVVPTACVLWFMTAAVKNERLAVEQRLTEAYRLQLAGVQRELNAEWDDRARELASPASGEAPAQTFARLVRAGVADAVLVFGEDGVLTYPSEAQPPALDAAAGSRAWSAAQGLEFSAGKAPEAAEAYARIAADTSDVDLEARALRAEARCRLKSGDRDGALAIFTGRLGEPRLSGAVDPQGRLVVPDAQLLALRLLEQEAEAHGLARELQRRLASYEGPDMPAAQRRFLMREVARVAPEDTTFDTLEAEDLAVRYLESAEQLTSGGELGRSGVPGIWSLSARDGRIVGLYDAASVRATSPATEDVRIELVPPGSLAAEDAFLSLSAGRRLPGWRLELNVADRGSFDSAARGQITAYFWTGALVIAAILGLALLIARQVGRQMRLTRLKNDLVATVSHELKTPLASMRLLVDTLLDGERHDAEQVREYLELISRENLRLSRLIEDFLTFSRMERNKQAFDKSKLAPEEVVATAADAVRPRFADCSFEVETSDDLPAIVGDVDALSTVLVNLLDNAHKYSDGERHIALRAYAQNGAVCFDVQDNGIGLSRRASKRIFDRFYQADQRLSRRGSGVGLGLSIVKFIVDAHGGTVAVVSEPGAGSTFTVRLPAARNGGESA